MSISIEQFSPRRLAGQLLMPRLEPAKYAESAEYRESIQNLVKKGIGGFCLFAGAPKEVLDCTTELQSIAPIPLLFSADYEWGLPMRLSGGTEFPHAMALGQGDNLAHTFRVAECIAREARSIGIHWNLAPVCDVQNNPQNPVIGIRSFGENPLKVGRHAAAFIQGTHHGKALSCAKHFPGHGNTITDSHIGVPIISATLQELEQTEFPPFAEAIQTACSSVMLGHIVMPNFFNDAPLSSISPTVVHYLRNNLTFDGIIVTDALDMGAVNHIPQHEYSPSLRAILAGVDIALLPADPLATLEEVQKAVSDNILSEASLRESVQRIFAAKEKLGLFTTQEPEVSTWTAHDHHESALTAAQKAILPWGNIESIPPLKTCGNIAGFALIANEKEMHYASMFFHYISRIYDNSCDFGFADTTITDDEISQFTNDTSDSELILFPIFSAGKTREETEKLSAIYSQLRGNKTVLPLFFATPYKQHYFPSEAALFTFSYCEASLAATAAALVQGFRK